MFWKDTICMPKKHAFGRVSKAWFQLQQHHVYDIASNFKNVHFEQKVDILFVIPTTLFLIQLKMNKPLYVVVWENENSLEWF